MMRGPICTWLLVTALCSASLTSPTAFAQASNGRGTCMPVVSVSYYKTPPGRQDEWLALYKKWHRPIIDYQIAHGVTISAKLYAAGSHAPGQPWDFAIIITSPPAGTVKPLALSRAQLIRTLFPNQEDYVAGERERWALTINHWDEDFVEVNLTEPLSLYAPVDGGCPK